MAHPLPDLPTLAKSLGMLLGRSVSVRKAPKRMKKKHDAFIASYHTADGPVRMLLVADPPAAAWLGAALSMMPTHEAETAAKTGVPSEVLLENYHEVANVLASTLSSSTHHLTLNSINPTAELPEDVASAFGAWKERVDANVQIDGYGGGQIALFVG